MMQASCDWCTASPPRSRCPTVPPGFQSVDVSGDSHWATKLSQFKARPADAGLCREQRAVAAVAAAARWTWMALTRRVSANLPAPASSLGHLGAWTFLALCVAREGGALIDSGTSLLTFPRSASHITDALKQKAQLVSVSHSRTLRRHGDA